MSHMQQMDKLQQIAGLLLETRLAALQVAARAKLESEAQLAGLGQPMPPAAGVSEVAGALAALAYQRWADARRAEVNLVLARQTAVWIDARDAACVAFGKKQALGGVAAKLGLRPSE